MKKNLEPIIGRTSHKPFSVWFEALIEHLQQQPLRLGRVIAPLKRDFNLQGNALQVYVRQTLNQLFTIGVLPVKLVLSPGWSGVYKLRFDPIWGKTAKDRLETILQAWLKCEQEVAVLEGMAALRRSAVFYDPLIIASQEPFMEGFATPFNVWLQEQVDAGFVSL